MRKTRKTRKMKRKYVNEKYIKDYKGGELRMKSSDLVNKHICAKNTKEKESPGLEIYQAIDTAFQLNDRSIGYLLDNFKKSKNMWFKFVLFNNSGINYIYIIRGAQINKHSVCLVHGLLDVTPNEEYNDMREKFNELALFKSDNGIIPNAENIPLVKELNDIITRDIPCMPVISAGSGTVNDDDINNVVLCINNKSGHYKPTIESMEIAKNIFQELTGIPTIPVEKADKDLLKIKYGEKYEMYSGICL